MRRNSRRELSFFPTAECEEEYLAVDHLGESQFPKGIIVFPNFIGDGYLIEVKKGPSQFPKGIIVFPN